MNDSKVDFQRRQNNDFFFSSEIIDVDGNSDQETSLKSGGIGTPSTAEVNLWPQI